MRGISFRVAADGVVQHDYLLPKRYRPETFNLIGITAKWSNVHHPALKKQRSALYRSLGGGRKSVVPVSTIPFGINHPEGAVLSSKTPCLPRQTSPLFLQHSGTNDIWTRHRMVACYQQPFYPAFLARQYHPLIVSVNYRVAILQPQKFQTEPTSKKSI